MSNSLADSVEIGVWTDGDASEAAFPTLEDALKNVNVQPKLSNSSGGKFRRLIIIFGRLRRDIIPRAHPIAPSGHKFGLSSGSGYLDRPARWLSPFPRSTISPDSQSHQLASLANKSGNPMCVCSSKELLAVGGSKGMIMLFNTEVFAYWTRGRDHFQGRLESFFPGEVEGGSVACVSFSEDGRFLAAGYGRGVVKIFRLKRRTLVHTIKDAVQPGTGVLQVSIHTFLSQEQI